MTAVKSRKSVWHRDTKESTENMSSSKIMVGNLKASLGPAITDLCGVRAANPQTCLQLKFHPTPPGGGRAGGDGGGGGPQPQQE